MNKLFSANYAPDKPWGFFLSKFFLFGAALFGVHYLDFSLAAVFGFLCFSAGFYFVQLPERRHFRVSFTVLIVGSLLALRSFGANFWAAVLGCAAFSFLFYLLFGLTAIHFKNRRAVYLFCNTVLLLTVFSLFFYVNKSENILGIYFLLLFAVVFFLLNECFKFLPSTDILSGLIIRNRRLTALTLAFFGLELFWAISLLPVGFINAALLLTLCVFLMRDLVLDYFAGRLSQRLFVYQSVIFIILTSLILAVSGWSI